MTSKDVTEKQNMRVAVRVRPNNRRELESNQVTIVKVIDTQTIVFDPEEDYDEFFFHGVKQTHRDITKKTHKKLAMEFDQVFDDTATNEAVFEECTKPLVRSLMDGYNCSVFVYGATGAGKTYTMLGNAISPGISFLTIQELFKQINNLEHCRKFDIGISYLEVYNEQVMNLLTKSGPLKLREDANGVVVSGLALKPIYNADDLFSLLEYGNTNRTQHPTDANSESSRSHAVFQVHIRMTDKKTTEKRTVKLSMIDLAGSERAASTKGIGLRFKEGASINKSLLALGNCINKLADGLKHIPYRDSNLTRILKDSLGGNCHTLMIANVSPSSLTYEDTYNTLKYATRAKKIRFTIKQNTLQTNMPKQYYVKKVCDQIDEIQKMKMTILNLEAQIKSNADTTKDLTPTYNDEDMKHWYAKINTVYAALLKSYENSLDLNSKEKIVRLKMKQKNFATESKKILTLDESKINEDVSRLQQSIDRFGKQITKQQNELSHWLKRHKENLKDWESLKMEINKEEKPLAIILKLYVRNKESDIEILKQQMKLSHALKAHSICTLELKHQQSINLRSLELIQRDYFLLRANNLNDIDYNEHLDRISKMFKGHGITFANENDDDNLALLTSDDALNFNNKRMHDGDSSPTKKRLRNLFNSKNEAESLDFGIELLDKNENPFKNPNDFMHGKYDADGLNSTFQIFKSKSGGNKFEETNNIELMKNILSEDNVNLTNRAAIAKAFQKSGNVAGVVKKIASNIKDNKIISPGRIRKLTRPIGRENQNGIVRTNRTASLRIKKK